VDVITIRRLDESDSGYLPSLCALLIDAVQDGASVGFLAPLTQERAAEYWVQVLSGLGGGPCLWVAEMEGVVVGSVQLAPSARENGRHRAEIQKLFVHTCHRGKGIAARLMDVAESHARSLQRSLLVLDTQAGSAAESVYRRLGWEKAGEIPDYAASPDGQLHATAYYYKRLTP
jgi:ribosomal protein S18 acetylase RimI-like enzyme